MDLILRTLANNPLLHDTSIKIYQDITTEGLTKDINIDYVLTKNNQMIGFIKIIAFYDYEKQIKIPKKSTIDKYTSSAFLERRIVNSPYASVPRLCIKAPFLPETKQNINNFIKECVQSPTQSCYEIKCYGKKRVEHTLPNVSFKDFLLDQFLITTDNKVTAFGQDYGLCKRYSFHPISHALIYEFVIPSYLYSQFYKIISFTNFQPSNLEDRIQILREPNPIDLKKIDANYTTSMQYLMHDYFLQNHKILQKLPNPPKTYREFADAINTILDSPKDQKEAKALLLDMMYLLPHSYPN